MEQRLRSRAFTEEGTHSMSTLADSHFFFPSVLSDYGFGGSPNSPASDIVSFFNPGGNPRPLILATY